MNQTHFRPGSILAIRHSTYTHYGVVSDRTDDQGMPLIIDNSAAAGLVSERRWQDAVGGRPFALASIQPKLPPETVVMRARQYIGKLKYSLIQSNCEAFARRAAGLEPTSQQVAACTLTVPSAAYLAYKATDGDLFWTLVSATAALAATTYAVSK
ncbi:lecithin retinol acyltransferase family protein [Marinobacter sp.]|uniref:lecithin retinol acyltransferase family protein n=1 Tax=Marinobacter sp. TaxID=50741 RepID=UPI003B519C0F